MSRQAKILELIETYDIETQDDLALHLTQSGYSVTQATVSRDIRELGLIKVAANGVNGTYKYAALAPLNGGSEEKRTPRLSALFKSSVVSVKYAENIIVIKTVSGAASSAAALIDALKEPLILGSVAGDDTIFVVVRSKAAAGGVADLFNSLSK
jgi:transcriptional regulator of arginine metabolism